MAIELGKQYRTRDGREVRIYATDAGTEYPVHGAIKTGDWWVAATWTDQGLSYLEDVDKTDLIEVKPRIVRERWVNVYGQAEGTLWPSKELADANDHCGARLACVKVLIDCEHGEGLTP